MTALDHSDYAYDILLADRNALAVKVVGLRERFRELTGRWPTEDEERPKTRGEPKSRATPPSDDG
jgi:hypothetical protein